MHRVVEVTTERRVHAIEATYRVTYAGRHGLAEALDRLGPGGA